MTTRRASWPATSSPRTTRTRRSPSSTTRRAYGKGLADETQKALNAAGGKEAMYEAYTAGEKDYTALVSKLKEGGIDVVYVGGYHTEGGLILRQLREQGSQAQMISGDAFVTDEFWTITGPAGEGTIMTFAPDPAEVRARPRRSSRSSRRPATIRKATRSTPTPRSRPMRRRQQPLVGRRQQEDRRMAARRQHAQDRARRPLARREGRHQGRQVRLVQVV